MLLLLVPVSAIFFIWFVGGAYLALTNSYAITFYPAAFLFWIIFFIAVCLGALAIPAALIWWLIRTIKKKQKKVS